MKRRIPIRWDQIELATPPDRPGASVDSKLSWLRHAIRALPIGTDHCFVFDGRQTLVYNAAKMIGCRIQTCKESGKGVRVWRLT